MRVLQTISAVAIVAFASALLLTAARGGVPHRLYGKHIAGQVVDSDTGQPIAGAHVAFLWESTIIPSGFTGHNSRTICYHAAATVTDAQGRFDVPAWSEWSTYDVDTADPTALVYATKYVPVQEITRPGDAGITTSYLKELYRLKLFSGTSVERMDMLFYGLANRGCHYGRESQINLYPMLKEIHNEAKKLPLTKENAETPRIIALLAAKAALAQDPEHPKSDQSLNEFIEKNLK